MTKKNQPHVEHWNLQCQESPQESQDDDRTEDVQPWLGSEPSSSSTRRSTPSARRCSGSGTSSSITRSSRRGAGRPARIFTRGGRRWWSSCKGRSSRLSAAILAAIALAACGARSSLDLTGDPGDGPPTSAVGGGSSTSTGDSSSASTGGAGGFSTSTGAGSSTSTGGLGGGGSSTSTGGLGGGSSTSTGGRPLGDCAPPGTPTVEWTVSLEALGLFGDDIAVDPGGNIYVSGPGPFVALFDGQGNLQWVHGEPGDPYSGQFARISLGPDDRLGLLTDSGLRHYVVENGALQLLGAVTGWFSDMALGPGGRVYASDGASSETRITAMDETLSPIWSVETTFANPIGQHLRADALGRVAHAGGHTAESGYTGFGWLDVDGMPLLSTHYPDVWASMLDLDLAGDGSVLVQGVANQAVTGWLERFTPEGVPEWYTEADFCGDREELWPCGVVRLPSGDAWSCINGPYFGATLSHFSPEGALVGQMTVDLGTGQPAYLSAIRADPSGRVIALGGSWRLSALIFP